MTRQRWSGKPDPVPRGGPVYCGFLFRGTKPRCTSRHCITSTIPRQSHITSHSTACIPTSTRALISSQSKQPKQTANPLAAAVPVPMATAHKGTALALMIRICRGTDKEANSEPAERFGCRQSFLLDTGPEYTRRKKIGSVQDLSRPIKQVILTHPVTRRRLGEQRRRLSGLDGTSNRGVMGKDTTSASVINSVYC